jgi:hypothetical protein
LVFFIVSFIIFIYSLFIKKIQEVYVFIPPLIISFVIVVALSISLFSSFKSGKNRKSRRKKSERKHSKVN